MPPAMFRKAQRARMGRWSSQRSLPLDESALPPPAQLVAGCWLLVAGCWLLVAGCWLLVAGHRLLVAGSCARLITCSGLLRPLRPSRCAPANGRDASSCTLRGLCMRMHTIICILYSSRCACYEDQGGYSCDDPVESFCLNQCSSHGTCSRSFCVCHQAATHYVYYVLYVPRTNYY